MKILRCMDLQKPTGRLYQELHEGQTVICDGLWSTEMYPRYVSHGTELFITNSELETQNYCSYYPVK